MVDRPTEDEDCTPRSARGHVVVRRYRGRRDRHDRRHRPAHPAVGRARRPVDRAPADRHRIPRTRVRAPGRPGDLPASTASGLRTQQVSNLVIGDPRRPDLTARFAQIQTRIKWNGSVEVYRVVARGVRLRGRLVHGQRQLGPDRQAAAAAERQAVRSCPISCSTSPTAASPGDAVRPAWGSRSRARAI